jgi:SAM-dependent methyltransferase
LVPDLPAHLTVDPPPVEWRVVEPILVGKASTTRHSTRGVEGYGRDVTESERSVPLDDRREQWRTDLAAWAIPDEILSQVDEKPWVHPVAQFTVEGEIADSPSHRIAREAVHHDGTVLDVGCGGGRAAMALVPPAGMLVGVDHQQGMLDAFSEAATRRGVRSHTILGDWPDVADDAPRCDVAVCHHVAYNVPGIGAFLQALNDHASHRVVLELPTQHPLTHLNPLWKRFWNLDRPTQPTASDLAAIAVAMGFEAHLEAWHDDEWGRRVALPDADRVRFARIRLCLTEDRDAEVAAALIELGDEQPREVATLWWDVQH